MQQSSGNLPKSIMGQVEALIAKEQQNASKLQILEEINKEATEIAEEQHRRLEEARLNLTTPLTSEVEASEAENYGGARPKVKSRAQVTTVTPDAYHQEAVAKKYDSHGRAKPEQQLEDRAALLRMKYLVLSLAQSIHSVALHRKIEEEMAVIIVKMRYFNYLRCQTRPLQGRK